MVGRLGGFVWSDPRLRDFIFTSVYVIIFWHCNVQILQKLVWKGDGDF